MIGSLCISSIRPQDELLHRLREALVIAARGHRVRRLLHLRTAIAHGNREATLVKHHGQFGALHGSAGTTMNTLANATLNPFVGILRRSGLLAEDLDYHVIRASMVIIFLFFGYQKWFEYEAQVLIPYISNGPLIWWMYPAFGVRGSSWFLGVAEWTFGALPFAGFWDKRLSILRAAGSVVTGLPRQIVQDKAHRQSARALVGRWARRRRDCWRA
jgi:Protein of unknown function, DUF417